MKSLKKRPSQTFRQLEMWNQLTNAFDLFSNQNQLLWTIFGVLWGANALLLVALFTTGNLPPGKIVGCVVAGVGLLLSLIWHIVQRRAIGYLKKAEVLISELERFLEIPKNLAWSADINEFDYLKYVGNRCGSIRDIMKGCSLGGAILWFLALLFFVSKDMHWI
jgi:hypothetical protein